MESMEPLSPPKPWRALLTALLLLFSIGIAATWTWYMLDRREQRESQHRFELDVNAIAQRIEGRMNTYEMVLRGVATAFAGDPSEISFVKWSDIVQQLRVWDLYPGISSIVWARYLHGRELNDFVARTHDDGRTDFQVFPKGRRTEYLPIEFIGPINERTSRVVGLDLFSQDPQNEAIRQAIDNGYPQLSQPMPDLYAVSPEPFGRMGLLMYFPVYQTGRPPDTVEDRRANFVGMTNAAFRAQHLIEGIFGAELELFHIALRDVSANITLLDNIHEDSVADIPPDWKPLFNKQVELRLYGRIWQLEITGTPFYEQGMVSRSQDLVLFMGLATALLMALLGGNFVWQRDRQVFAGQRVESRLREQAKQLILANRYKSEFLANMSHELRTPLNSILILSDQLRENSGGNLTEKQTRHADIVYRAGNDLLQLINDVLDLAKVESGRMQLSMEPVNLQDLLVDLDASMRPLAEAKKLHLYIPRITAKSELPMRVFTDRVRLHQILRNLLSNAIKFTDAGLVHLALTKGENQDDGSVIIHFAVRDTGIGIAPAQHKQAFEAFQQLDGSTRRRYGGTGLGLAITRQLVKALGGDIELQSTPGQGSTFTVHLPMQVVTTSALNEIPPPQRTGTGPSLLIVEDDSQFASIITEQAHSHGFSSVHCISGLQALELLKTENFNAVILDILLPDISGWQLFRRLRALPAHSHTPVHIISCLPHPDGLEEQGTHYLTKPIERDVLDNLLASLQNGGKNSQGTLLLLVEDIEAEREHYRERLTELGFNVTTADCAQSAQEAWMKGRFDVLVLDLNLPDQDGFSLLDNLNKLRSLQDTRVVINTGLDVSQEGLQRLSGYSAVVVHKKADNTDRLGQAVQGFLEAIHNDEEAADEVKGKAQKASQATVGAATPAISAPTTVETLPPAAVTASEPAASLEGRRVLLVDDDVRNVYAMSALLDDFGLEVSTANNGEEAIICFGQSSLDLILMDMSMPVMDGYTATNLLKTEHGCTIPIIALTAHAMKGDREKCLAAGADDYLPKPVERRALRAILERWLKVSL